MMFTLKTVIRTKVFCGDVHWFCFQCMVSTHQNWHGFLATQLYLYVILKFPWKIFYKTSPQARRLSNIMKFALSSIHSLFNWVTTHHVARFLNSESNFVLNLEVFKSPLQQRTAKQMGRRAEREPGGKGTVAPCWRPHCSKGTPNTSFSTSSQNNPHLLTQTTLK